MPTRDTVQGFMVLGIVATTVFLCLAAAWLLTPFFDENRNAGILIPMVIIPIAILLSGLLVHRIAYKMISAKYGKKVAEELVFFNTHKNEG